MNKADKALIFDCDGVLADTEEFGHLPAFNRMWRQLGVPWQWSVEEYGRKLKIGGGKERMTSLFGDPDFLQVFKPPETEVERKALIATWHKRKGTIYKEIVDSSCIPSRSGVKRLAEESLALGWKVAVASTSAPESVDAVLRQVMGQATAERFSLVLAGDVVEAKKPAPDIYLLAAQQLAVEPARCVAIEDSNNGLVAAVSAGMKCVVTVSSYTRDEDFSLADLVVSCLGDPQKEICRVLANRSGVVPGEYLTVDDLEELVALPAQKSDPVSNSPYLN